MNEYKDRKITRTSFLDDAFRKNLESALRFGNPLLVQVCAPRGAAPAPEWTPPRAASSASQTQRRERALRDGPQSGGSSASWARGLKRGQRSVRPVSELTQRERCLSLKSLSVWVITVPWNFPRWREFL